jgi:hypothetical protein
MQFIYLFIAFNSYVMELADFKSFILYNRYNFSFANAARCIFDSNWSLSSFMENGIKNFRTIKPSEKKN